MLLLTFIYCYLSKSRYIVEGYLIHSSGFNFCLYPGNSKTYNTAIACDTSACTYTYMHIHESLLSINI